MNYYLIIDVMSKNIYYSTNAIERDSLLKDLLLTRDRYLVRSYNNNKIISIRAK